ncbi:hypothetical protein CK203_080132 [Vitis vinifera]|uniref:Reverse transcriptase domain-containing protein n=1 Tax=Vitis vinifera TaxID=29760 RepID=A0A438F2N3_VITVI|nr:hypothetical protein CK203_080132 [Vitis vinifera]
MEALSCLIKRAVSGGFLTSCRVKGRGGEGVQFTHLLYVDDTLIFCDAFEGQLAHLSWVLMWFKVIFGLRINLDKSEILPVGRVENLEELALELWCKVGSSLPYIRASFGCTSQISGGVGWGGVEVTEEISFVEEAIYI